MGYGAGPGLPQMTQMAQHVADPIGPDAKLLLNFALDERDREFFNRIWGKSPLRFG
jgi:hypothetical protein